MSPAIAISVQVSFRAYSRSRHVISRHCPPPPLWLAPLHSPSTFPPLIRPYKGENMLGHTNSTRKDEILREDELYSQ